MPTGPLRVALSSRNRATTHYRGRKSTLAEQRQLHSEGAAVPLAFGEHRDCSVVRIHDTLGNCVKYIDSSRGLKLNSDDNDAAVVILRTEKPESGAAAFLQFAGVELDDLCEQFRLILLKFIQ